MTENKELEQIFKDMLERTIQDIEEDEFYQQDVKKLPLRINWQIDDIIGFQIFEEDYYSYKFGEELESPDLIFIIKNSELGKKFLKGELEGFKVAPRADYKGRFKIQNVVGWKESDQGEGKGLSPIINHWMTVKFDRNRDFHPYTLMRLPIFKNLVREKVADLSKNFGAYLPINKSLDYENQVLPLRVIKHFIDKASHIVKRAKCGCREIKGCKNHDHTLGCMYLGRDTLTMKASEGKLQVLTKEEAWDIVNRAYDDGLIPVMGRSMGEAEIFDVEETGHFMSMCFCCACCCVNGKLMKYGPGEVSSILFPRMKGLEVKVDLDKCIGCGKCVEVCAFGARELVDGKGLMDQVRCLGCGRCVDVCPTEATTIEIDDPKRIEEHIKTLESYVDVT